MKKYTFNELENMKKWSKAVIVFKNESFDKEYPEISRSYEISHTDYWFKSDAISCALYGYCLDGNDRGVRLDWYMRAIPEDGIGKRWIVDYCYITEEKEARINENS